MANLGMYELKKEQLEFFKKQLLQTDKGTDEYCYLDACISLLEWEVMPYHLRRVKPADAIKSDTSLLPRIQELGFDTDTSMVIMYLICNRKKPLTASQICQCASLDRAKTYRILSYLVDQKIAIVTPLGIKKYLVCHGPNPFQPLIDANLKRADTLKKFVV